MSKKEQIKELLNKGMSAIEIANRMDTNRTYVQQIKKEMKHQQQQEQQQKPEGSLGLECN